jgi:hypothetical protein
MALPIFQTGSKDLSQMQTTWAQKLNPVIDSPISQGLLLKSVSLSSGANTINHTLGRKLQGWIVVRIRSGASIYDTQDSNSMPELTLTLVSSANAVVDLFVF